MSISAKERQSIPKNEFGVPGKRKYPLDNPEHIESAARLINHGDITSSEKKTLANKILRRANEEGVDTSGMDAVKKIAEQVPPMSDGTSRGNVAPHLMAPYLEGKDELFARLHGMKEVEALTIDRARTIVNQIKTKVEADSKPPTGNQNCQLCVWCAEAQCRGMHVLPRPIYSPRDPALEIKGETIVKSPVRQNFTSQKNLIDTVRGAVDSRWYVHVNWKDSEGGHEFLVVNIQDYAYLMDPQAGIFQELGTLDSSHSYFRDANMMNSYMVRLDNRTFNSTLLADVNDMSKVLPWDPKLDIPYMKEHGLLSDEDYQLAMNMGDLPVQEAACTASLLNVKNQLMNLLGNDFEFIGGSLIPKFTMKSRMKPDVAIEVNIVGPNVEVTPVYKGIPDILHKRKGIALMQASHVVADFANEIVDKYNPTTVKESFMDEYAPYQEGTGIIEKARNMTLMPVRDFKYDKVFYGDPTNGGSVRALNGKPLFVTPYPGLASIFLGRRNIFRQLSQMGYHEVNLGYDEWGELERCDQPLTDVHVYVKNQPDLKPFTAEYDGYLHTIDCSQLKENIFRYPWMSDPDHEVLIAKVPEVKIENVQRLHIKYHVRGIRGKVPETPYQEGAFQDIKNGVNPYSSKLVFHVTDKSHFDGQIFEPRVPEYLDPYDPNDKYFEDNTTPRVCFSTSIEGALNGIMCNMERDTPERFNKMYVYIPEKPFKEYKHKTTKDIVSDKTVWDANVTREVWITEPVRMKLYGVIQVDQVNDMTRKKAVPNAKNEKHTRPYFTFKWHWVVPPKVLEKSTKFDYSIDKVAMWLSNDLKKFKYGLIKDGRLQTGNVSESDYQKYWVYHSGEEVDQAGGGNCWDYVEYEAGFLKAYGVPYKKYFMNFTKTDGKTPVNTHTICVVPYEGKFIYIEGAFKRITSEWGHEWRRTFDSLEEIFKYVAEVSAEYENQDLNYGVWDYTDAKIDYGTPADDFCNWIMSKCKMVYDGEAKKTMLTKEGYRMDQTEDLMITESKKAENLSETEDMEDITIGDLDLDDEENGDETEESISVEETPLDDVEWDGESEDNEPKDDDTEDDNGDETTSTSMPSRWDTEKTPPELEEIPGYLKDRMSAADKVAVEQPDEKLDADNVDLGQFGKDTSDVQNDYDQKEVTILMKLMASEADAMNEYMDGAKETNVDVLRRLYADIANEERFHMEQLLYAKCELTGEKYEPKDPDVKSEYQELLEMGMDEETAMQTAIDKCHIRGSISISDDGEEIASLKEDVQTLESALMMFDAMYQSTEIVLESGNSSPEDVDKAVDVFVESCLMQEAVYDSTAAKSEKHPLSKANRRGPIQLLRSAIGFVIKTLMTLIRKFVEFCNRIRNHSRSIKRFIQQYGMQGIFEQKYFFYFINLNFPESSYVDEHLDTLLALAYDTVEACAQYLHIKLNNDNIPADVTSLPRDPKLDIRGNMERGAELLAGAHLVKSAFVVPQDADTEQRVSQALFGYSDTMNQAGKSNNTLNEIRIRCDRWSRFMQYVNSVLIGMDAMTQQSDSIYYTDQKRYDKGVKILTTVVKTCKAWISAMQYDINQIMSMNQELLKKTEESDAARIENDQTAKTKNETYNKFYSTPESTPQQRPSRFSV